MNNELLLMLVGYLSLKEEIKESKNPVKEIKLALCKYNLKKEIISLIDDSVLSFRELYKLLKLYEDRRNRRIQFETRCIICAEDEFEDNVSIPCIFVKKVGYRCKRESEYIRLVKIRNDAAIANQTGTKNIAPYSIANPDIALFFEQFKTCFKKDYEDFTDFVISYLIYKHL